MSFTKKNSSNPVPACARPRDPQRCSSCHNSSQLSDELGVSSSGDEPSSSLKRTLDEAGLCSDCQYMYIKQRKYALLSETESFQKLNGPQNELQDNIVLEGMESEHSLEKPSGLAVEYSKTETESKNGIAVEMETDTQVQAATNNYIYQRSYFHINNLPYGVMLQVFGYLPMYDLLCRAALVCKNWHAITNQSSLWKVVRLDGKLKVDDEILWRMTSLSPCVLHLDISDNKRVTDEGLIAVLQKCRTLKTLNLSRCRRLTDTGLKAIGIYCPQLQRLYLNNCRLSDEAVFEIGHCCKQLRLLSVADCDITYLGFGALVEGCRMLTAVSLDHCYTITDGGLKDLIDKCPDIEELSVVTCRLSDQGFAYIRKLHRLKKLDISSMDLSKKTVTDIMQCCPLVEIWIASIDDECLAVIAQYGRRLQRLTVESCYVTDEGLSSLAEDCKTLTFIDLSHCERVTAEGVRRLVQCCPLLAYLRLFRCDSVSGETIDQLAMNYRRVKFNFIPRP